MTWRLGQMMSDDEVNYLCAVTGWPGANKAMKLWLDTPVVKLCKLMPLPAFCCRCWCLLALLLQCQLVTTKQAANSATAAALNGGPVSSAQMQIQPPSQQDRNGRRSSSSGLPAAGFAASAAQELRLHVPAIGARLDSRQFEVLVDVIQNIAMAPLPTVRGIAVCTL